MELEKKKKATCVTLTTKISHVVSEKHGKEKEENEN